MINFFTLRINFFKVEKSKPFGSSARSSRKAGCTGSIILGRRPTLLPFENFCCAQELRRKQIDSGCLRSEQVHCDSNIQSVKPHTIRRCTDSSSVDDVDRHPGCLSARTTNSTQFIQVFSLVLQKSPLFF